jgi:UDP-glucose 4-epimerase
MKILVTGGLGFIGSHTTVELQNEGFEVIIVDNLSNTSLNVLDGISNITGKIPAFEKLDLRKRQSTRIFKRHT